MRLLCKARHDWSTLERHRSIWGFMDLGGQIYIFKTLPLTFSDKWAAPPFSLWCGLRSQLSGTEHPS